MERAALATGAGSGQWYGDALKAGGGPVVVVRGIEINELERGGEHVAGNRDRQQCVIRRRTRHFGRGLVSHGIGKVRLRLVLDEMRGDTAAVREQSDREPPAKDGFHIANFLSRRTQS